MNAKTASEGSAFRDFSHQSAAYLRHHQDFIWWELNPGPHPPPDTGDRFDLSPFFLSRRALFLRILVAAHFDLWFCEVDNSLYYTFTGVLQL
jgi:hypothetical protein